MKIETDADRVMAGLRPVLAQLEAMRRDALGRRRKALGAALSCGCGGLVLAGVVWASFPDNPLAGIVTAAVGLVAAVVLNHVIHGNACGNYLLAFKERAFRGATKMIAPEMDYSPRSLVGMEQFKRSGLFNSRIDRYRGEDCFHGRVGETKVLLSELHVEREERSTDSEGRTTKRWVTVFKGIYLIADFHKHFRGQVLIEPDVAEAAFGWLGRKMQGLTGDLVRLENPEFERAFKVRSNDPVEARYLLTPDMQERLLALRGRWPRGISAALIDSHLHVAIPNKENWFEPDLRRPADQAGQLSTFVRQLACLLDIPRQLDLDTRIWTK